MCGETQVEQLSEVSHEIHEFAEVESSEMSMTMEQVVTQLQQQNLDSQTQCEQSINLATAQVWNRHSESH